MNLRNLRIDLADDGFTIVDNHHDVPEGATILARYSVDEVWFSKSIVFLPSPSLIEKIITGARHLFVYTGGTPSRVVLLDPSASPLEQPLPASPPRISSLYSNENYTCLPPSFDSVWEDDFLPYFLGGYVTSSILNHPQYDSLFGGANLFPTPAFRPSPVTPDSSFSSMPNIDPAVSSPSSFPQNFTSAEPNAY